MPCYPAAINESPQLTFDAISLRLVLKLLLAFHEYTYTRAPSWLFVTRRAAAAAFHSSSVEPARGTRSKARVSGHATAEVSPDQIIRAIVYALYARNRAGPLARGLKFSRCTREHARGTRALLLRCASCDATTARRASAICRRNSRRLYVEAQEAAVI